MKAYGQITLTVVNDGLQGESALNVIVSNESQSIPCTSSGLVSRQTLLEIPFCGYEGFNKVSCEVSVGKLPSGMSVVTENSTPEKDGKIILNIAKNSSLGGNDILTGVISLVFTIKGKSITKQFSWTKVKEGVSGTPARIYSISPSTLIVKRLPKDTFSPETVSFSATYKDGNSTSSNAYSGRFIIERSINGTTFNTVYTSSTDESTATYTVQKDDTAIKCKLYASGGITNELDFQTVTVLNDGSISTTGGINLALGTNQGDRNWDWDMQVGDYTTEAVTIDGINCAKLIRGTQEQTGWSFIRYKKTALNKVKTNENYVLSFECKTNKDTTMNARFTDGAGNYDVLESRSPESLSIKKDVWNKCVFYWKTKKTFTVNDGVFIYLGDMDSSSGTYYIFRNLQVERGTIPTDWKPAPEDIYADMSVITSTVTELGVKVDNIKKEIDLKVSKTELTDAIDNYDKDRVQGIRDQVSQLNIDVEGITGTVKDVQTVVNTKADGSVVHELSEKFTEFKQTSEGFQQTVEKNYAKKSDLDEALKKNSTFAISLTNDDHTIPTDPNGNNGIYIGCETTVTAMFGAETVTGSCTFTQSPSDGVSGNWNDKTYTYTVTNMITDTGYVDISASYTVQINGKQEVKTATKRFVLSKRKDSVAENAIVYSLQASDSIIRKVTENTFNPSTITFSAYYREGSSTQLPFNGIFKISESTDGNTYIEKYVSQVNESSKEYSPSSGNVQKIQCSLYKDTQKKELLDIHTVTIISDTVVDIGVRNLIRNSKTLIFDSYGFVDTPIQNYVTDESGNILTDENNNTLVY